MIDKAQIYREVFDQYREWYGEEHMKQGACFYWTLTGLGVLLRHGIRGCLQAGTFAWPIIPFDEDDGKLETASHFCYEYEFNAEKERLAFAGKYFPEIHIWIGLPDTQEIVDFSTKFLPHLVTTKHGLPWRTPPPPDYIWHTKAQMPERVLYRVQEQACRFVVQKMLLDRKDQGLQRHGFETHLSHFGKEVSV